MFSHPAHSPAGSAVTSDESAKVPSTDDSSSQPAAADQQAALPDGAPGVDDARAARWAHWREAVSIVMELAGIGVLSAGCWLIRPWAGLIVLGAGLIVIGFASSPRFDRGAR
jgi:hypothetical protein